MAELFKLPASSYEEVVKIIKAYSGSKEGTVQTLDDIAQSTKIDRTIVSSNNGFLVQMGIVTEGNKKVTTDSGRLLGRAYTTKIDAEITRIWGELLSENEFINRMVSAIRIRNGMDKSEFVNHVLYSSGQNSTSKNKAGAGTIVEILKVASMISELDGKIDVIEMNATVDDPRELNVASSIPLSSHVASTKINRSGSICINLNIDVSCNVDELEGLAGKIKQFIKGMENEQGGE